MNDVVSEPVSVTGTISDITVGWIIGFGCLLCDTESCAVVSVASGAGPPRESLVISITGDGYAVFVVTSPGMSKLSTDWANCGDMMVQCPSGSEEVVLVVSFCRTWSSVDCVSTLSNIKKLSRWLFTIEGRAFGTEDRKRDQRCFKHIHFALVKQVQQPETPAGFANPSPRILSSKKGTRIGTDAFAFATMQREVGGKA
jgi:hypothetical protein